MCVALTYRVSGQMERVEPKQTTRAVPETPHYMAPARSAPMQGQSEDIQRKIWVLVFTFYTATDHIKWPYPNEPPTYPTRLMLVCKFWRVRREHRISF